MATDTSTNKPGLMRTLRDRFRRTKSNLRRDAELGRRGDHPPSTSWDPFQSMREALLDPLFRQLPWRSRGPDDLWAPTFEVRENGHTIRIIGDLPGVSREDVEVNVVDNYLTVSARRGDDEINGDNYLARERSFGRFSRSFTMPDSVDFDHITSSLSDGVLTIVVPKMGRTKSRKIAIGGSGPKS